MAHATAEDRAHVLEQLLVGLVELRLQLVRHAFAGGHQVADLDAELDCLAGALLLLGGLRLDGCVGERIDLLEHARDRGQVGGFDFLQLGHDLLGVAAEVGERAAEIERCELDEQREGVRER